MPDENDGEEQLLLLTRVSKYSSRLAFLDGVLVGGGSEEEEEEEEEEEQEEAQGEEILAFLLRVGESFGVGDDAALLTTPFIQDLTSSFQVGDTVRARSRKPVDGAASLLSLQLVARATPDARRRGEDLAAAHKARSRSAKRGGERARERESKTWERRKPKAGRACKLWINEGRCTRVDADGNRWCSWGASREERQRENSDDKEKLTSFKQITPWERRGSLPSSGGSASARSDDGARPGSSRP